MKNSTIKQNRSSPGIINTQSANLQNNTIVNNRYRKYTNSISKNNHGYQSNYHYFINKINDDNTNQNNQYYKPTHQRYSSLNNTRMAVIQNSPTLHQQANNSSPYLLQFNKKDKNCQQIQINSLQEYKTIPSKNLSKHTKKLSMRNIPKDYQIYSQCTQPMKQSQISTINQTSNTSHASKFFQTKINNQEIIKYCQNLLQKKSVQFIAQIKQQSILIQNLQSQIRHLNIKLIQKQQKINNLLYNNKINEQVYGSKNNNMISNNQRICNLQKFVRQIIPNKNGELKQSQNMLNLKMGKIMEAMFKIMQNKNIVWEQKSYINDELKKFEEKLNKTMKIMKQNRQNMSLISQTKKQVFNITNKCYQIKQFVSSKLNRLSRQNSLNETAKFIDPKQQNYQIKLPSKPKYFPQQSIGNPELNDSNSYFFHPSQMNNIDRITELFIHRDGKPIQCYIDNQNQVKYKDTNTFLFNKKGDIVRLTQNQIKYYTDIGFIISN